MYSVEFRFSNQSLWSSVALPATLQAAQTIASGVSNPALSDETRVVPSRPTGLLLDIRA